MGICLSSLFSANHILETSQWLNAVVEHYALFDWFKSGWKGKEDTLNLFHWKIRVPYTLTICPFNSLIIRRTYITSHKIFKVQ